LWARANLPIRARPVPPAAWELHDPELVLPRARRFAEIACCPPLLRKPFFQRGLSRVEITQLTADYTALVGPQKVTSVPVHPGQDRPFGTLTQTHLPDYGKPDSPSRRLPSKITLPISSSRHPRHALPDGAANGKLLHRWSHGSHPKQTRWAC
jgi:hypothetical protein